MPAKVERYPPAERGAQAIKNAFDLYTMEFKAITCRGKSRFEDRDWHGMQKDALERLDLYSQVVRVIVADIHNILSDEIQNKLIWQAMKTYYSRLIAPLGNLEIAETFFNSITRRIFATVGVDPRIEFVDTDFEISPARSGSLIYHSYSFNDTLMDLFLRVLGDYSFRVPYADINLDASLVGKTVQAEIQNVSGSPRIKFVDFLDPVFYRGKETYLIGRIRHGSHFMPIVLSLRNEDKGIWVDAVLLTEDEISILFSFTRSYFHVLADKPHELIYFLSTIMPHKRVAELYISIGFHKHGKTELYREFLRHLGNSSDQFEIARGERGMVMIVFTMPSFDMVFKVIRDHFGEPKTTTRQEVIDRYQLVFKHDRAGRLVDAQEFEHLRLEKSRFSDELLEELQKGAPNSVTVEDGYVSIKHLYIERRVAPLNIYLGDADEIAAGEAVLDYGNAIKDLATTGIFPGDILIKNFGVTRHGRVVFYDYDELTLLTDCNFRRFPQARDFSDDFEAERWFYVGKNDIFPQEFKTFLGLTGHLRETFLRVHQDLFEVDYWKEMQARAQAGDIFDIFPYKQSRRLHAMRLA